MPPKVNSSIASTCAASDGSPHGSRANHATQPRPPRARAPLSSEATTLKNVSRLGKKTAKVRKAWTSFQPTWIPGSVYWWWKPSGVERSEEHTSELQSQSNLVCRLLLEKQKMCRLT